MRILGNVWSVLLFVSASISLAAQITVDYPISAMATIHIYASKSTGDTIPRTIFGSFLEPIGNSTYNGLWAEILQNPSLEAGLWSAANINRMVRDEPALTRTSELGLPYPGSRSMEIKGTDMSFVMAALRTPGVPLSLSEFPASLPESGKKFTCPSIARSITRADYMHVISAARQD